MKKILSCVLITLLTLALLLVLACRNPCPTDTCCRTETRISDDGSVWVCTTYYPALDGNCDESRMPVDQRSECVEGPCTGSNPCFHAP